VLRQGELTALAQARGLGTDGTKLQLVERLLTAQSGDAAGSSGGQLGSVLPSEDADPDAAFSPGSDFQSAADEAEPQLSKARADASTGVCLLVSGCSHARERVDTLLTPWRLLRSHQLLQAGAAGHCVHPDALRRCSGAVRAQTVAAAAA
jgi:hypothetical protein